MLQLWLFRSWRDGPGGTPSTWRHKLPFTPHYFSITVDDPLLPPVPIYWRQIRLVFASITSKPRAQHKKKHILHVCVLAGLIPCVFRLLPVVSDCFHSQQNASAVCLEQEKDPHVLTWPNKPDSKRKAPQECEAVSFRWYYSDGVDCRCIKPGSGPALTSPVRW